MRVIALLVILCLAAPAYGQTVTSTPTALRCPDIPTKIEVVQTTPTWVYWALGIAGVAVVGGLVAGVVASENNSSALRRAGWPSR